jgi:hypothetical protein
MNFDEEYIALKENQFFKLFMDTIDDEIQAKILMIAEIRFATDTDGLMKAVKLQGEIEGMITVKDLVNVLKVDEAAMRMKE